MPSSFALGPRPQATPGPISLGNKGLISAPRPGVAPVSRHPRPHPAVPRRPIAPDLRHLPRWLRRLYHDQCHDCRVWDGAVDGQGYPRRRWEADRFGRRYRPTPYVHRQEFQLFHGRPLEPGERVYRTCSGGQLCVNPRHMTTEPPARRRKRPRSAKLSRPKVRAIREAWAREDRPTQRELAARYGVSRSAISLVVRGVTWPP